MFFIRIGSTDSLSTRIMASGTKPLLSRRSVRTWLGGATVGSERAVPA
jgi:hypothetical protein